MDLPASWSNLLDGVKMTQLHADAPGASFFRPRTVFPRVGPARWAIRGLQPQSDVPGSPGWPIVPVQTGSSTFERQDGDATFRGLRTEALLWLDRDGRSGYT